MKRAAAITLLMILTLCFALGSARAAVSIAWEEYYDDYSSWGYPVIKSWYDGGYLIMLSPDCDILKTSASGVLIDTMTYDGKGIDIQPCQDSGFYLLGKRGMVDVGYETFVIKHDLNRDSLWSWVSDAHLKRAANDMILEPDGGCLLAGSITGAAGQQVWMMKINADGTQGWQNMFGGPDTLWSATRIEPLNGGGYVIGGKVSGYDDSTHAFLATVDAGGNLDWSRAFGVSVVDRVVPAVCEDGGFLCGTTIYYGYISYPFQEPYLLKVNAAGDSLWTQIYSSIDIGRIHDIHPLADGGFLIGGSKGEYIWAAGYLAEIDAAGTLGWVYQYQYQGIATYANTMDFSRLNRDSSIAVVGGISNWDYPGTPWGPFAAKFKHGSFTINTRLSATMEPTVMRVTDAYEHPPITADILIGDFFGEYGPYYIHYPSLTINGTVPCQFVSEVPVYPGFNDEVVRLEFSVRDFLIPFEPIWDTTVVPYALEGEFVDGWPFAVEGSVMVIGHLTGDVNNDNAGPDISDLIYLVDFMFTDGPEPPVRGAEDIDHSGVHDIADLIALIGRVF